MRTASCFTTSTEVYDFSYIMWLLFLVSMFVFSLCGRLFSGTDIVSGGYFRMILRVYALFSVSV